MSSTTSDARTPLGHRVSQRISPLIGFLQSEVAGALLLLGCTALAIFLANSSFAHDLHSIWETHFGLQLGGFGLHLSLHHWLNDGLMAVFFLLIGLEIKREVMYGELNSVRKSMLPILAAVGGMAAPGLFYYLFNHGTPMVRGWATPTATDIAFSLGVLSLLGKRVPYGLKIFLATLAIVDDLGAIVLIATFYAGDIQAIYLLLAGAVLALLIVASVLKVRLIGLYLLLGACLWYLLLKSGVHATLAGVLTAFAIPTRSKIAYEEFDNRLTALSTELQDCKNDPDAEYDYRAAIKKLERACENAQAPSQRIEHTLQTWVAYFIMPLFALGNAGVALGAGAWGNIGSNVSLGVMLGLLLGKPIGIMLASFLAVKLRLAQLPTGVHWGKLMGASMLCGIGFTMSIFISSLAFGNEPEIQDQVKLAILTGSGLSALLGLLVLFLQPASTYPTNEPSTI